MFAKPKLKLLSEAQCTRIHEATLKVFTETGIRFDTQEALDIFKKHGAKVEKNMVYIPPTMVEKCLETVPKTFTWHGRNESRSVVIGEDYAIQPSVGCLYIQDEDNGRRIGTREDFANVQKLHHSSTVGTFVGGSPIDIGDVDSKYKHLYMLYESIKHSDKPLTGNCVEGIQNNLDSMEMVEIAMGKKGIMDEKVILGMLVNPFSPLAYDPVAADAVVAYAMKKQAVTIFTCSMAGVTGPATLFSMMVAQNAEILAGLVLAQLVNPGTPVICGHASSIANMSEVSYLTGAPDMAIMFMASVDLMQDFYKLPCKLMPGITDSKVVDSQAGYETMQTMLLSILSGVTVFETSLGVLDSFMTTSLEKFIIDEEIIERAKFIAKGMNVSDDMLLLDAIKEVGPGASFLEHPSTFKHFRDYFKPMISETRSYHYWESDGCMDIREKANRKWKERLDNAPESMIDSELDKELQQFITYKETGKK